MEDVRVSRLIKSVYFFLYAGFGVLSPYFAIFIESRGLSKPQIGILSMIPNIFCVLLGAPLSMVADAWKCPLQMIMLSIVLSIVLTLCIFWFGYSFASFALLVIVGAIVRAPLTSLVDSFTIGRLQNASEFGNYRLWGAASFGLSSLLGGLLLTPRQGGDPTKSEASAQGFDWIFYLNATFTLLAVLVVMRLAAATPSQSNFTQLPSSSQHSAAEEVEEKLASKPLPAPPVSSSSNTVSVLRSILATFRSNPRIASFAFVVFVSGIGDGVIEAFLFIRLKELGASGLLLGLARLQTCVAEVPAFILAGKLYNLIGVWRTLSVTQVAYVIRFACYALLVKRYLWLILLVELLNGLTFAVTWQASCQYAAEVAPPGTEATMQSLIEGLHWGLGSGLGALIAGYVYHWAGAVPLFAASSLLCCLSFLCSFITGFFESTPSKGEDAINPEVVESPLNKFSIVGEEEEEQEEVDGEIQIEMVINNSPQS